MRHVPLRFDTSSRHRNYQRDMAESLTRTLGLHGAWDMAQRNQWHGVLAYLPPFADRENPSSSRSARRHGE